MVDLVVDTERHCTTNDITKIAKREPRRNVTAAFVALGIACGNGSFDTPEEACTNTTGNCTNIDEPLITKPIVDV